MLLSPRQRRLRFWGVLLIVLLIALLLIGWRFIHPYHGKWYVIFWLFCLILALLLVLFALEEIREISKYYLEKRKEIMDRTLKKK